MYMYIHSTSPYPTLAPARRNLSTIQLEQMEDTTVWWGGLAIFERHLLYAIIMEVGGGLPSYQAYLHRG